MSEKTELPTPQKLRKAREEGQVAKSKDFTQTVLVVALFGYLLGNAANLVRDMTEMMLMPAGLLALAGLDFDLALNALATQLLRKGLALLAPFLLIVIGLGLLVECAQTGMLVSFKAAMPSGKKLNVVSNVKNMFGKKSLVEFLKSNLKIALLSVLVYRVLLDALPALITLPHGGLAAVGTATGLLLEHLIVCVSIGYLVISLADLLWQKHQHLQQLKMSKDEVKRDYKEAEGDPHIKHKRRELHRELLEHDAVENTRNASVVVTNPTHLAVAIAWRQGVTPLPVVLAKGEGQLAERIKARALSLDIPVLENVPLARALMATAEMNAYIPSDLIEPVAEVLRLVQDMKDPDDEHEDHEEP